MFEETFTAKTCFNQYSACQIATNAMNFTIIGDGATTQFYTNGKIFNKIDRSINRSYVI